MNLHPTMLLDATNLLGKEALAIFSPFYCPKVVHLESKNLFKQTSAKLYVQDYGVFLEWVQINVTIEL